MKKRTFNSFFDTQGIDTVTQLKLYMRPISKGFFTHPTDPASSRFYVVRPTQASACELSSANSESVLAENPVITSAASFLLEAVLQPAAFQTCNIHDKLSAFSNKCGSLNRVTEKNTELKGITVFRNWIGWEAVKEKREFNSLSVPSDDSPIVFGAMFTDLKRSLSSRFQKLPTVNDRWLSLRSATCENSLPSPVMRLFLSLAQDIHLSPTDVPTKDASIVSVLHGLGLPTTFINSQFCAVSGLKEKDATPASFLSNELNLLQALLLKLRDQTETPEGVRNLCSVFPLPFVELVKYLQAHGSGAEHTSLDALFVSFLLERLKEDASAPVTLAALQKQVRESVLEVYAKSNQSGLNEALVSALGAKSLFANLVGALSKFQHEIRYQSDDCQMPKAGEERAYLNSIFRNWMCKLLDFQLPAEIAQFDLLLRANRAVTNSHFNDYSSNGALVKHLLTVAASASGKKSAPTVALSAMTKHLEERASSDDALFVFDEHGPVPEIHQAGLIR